MELQTKPPESLFENIGDVQQGLYMSYEKKAGNFNKDYGILTIKTREGVKKINCPSHLTMMCDDNLASFPGCVLTIWLVELKNTGKGNPMKVFRMDATKKGQPLPSLPSLATPSAAEAPGPDTDDSIPF